MLLDRMYGSGRRWVGSISSFKTCGDICQRDKSASVLTWWQWFFVGELETLISTTACKSSVLAAYLGIALIEASIMAQGHRMLNELYSLVMTPR